MHYHIKEIEDGLRQVKTLLEAGQRVVPDMGFNMGTVYSTYTADATNGFMTRYKDQAGQECGSVACIAGWLYAILSEKPLNEEYVPYPFAHGEDDSDFNKRLDGLYMGEGSFDDLSKLTDQQAAEAIGHFLNGEHEPWACVSSARQFEEEGDD